MEKEKIWKLIIVSKKRVEQKLIGMRVLSSLKFHNFKEDNNFFRNVSLLTLDYKEKNTIFRVTFPTNTLYDRNENNFRSGYSIIEGTLTIKSEGYSSDL
jgi:hypothetical protein